MVPAGRDGGILLTAELESLSNLEWWERDSYLKSDPIPHIMHTLGPVSHLPQRLLGRLPAPGSLAGWPQP